MSKSQDAAQILRDIARALTQLANSLESELHVEKAAAEPDWHTRYAEMNRRKELAWNTPVLRLLVGNQKTSYGIMSRITWQMATGDADDLWAMTPAEFIEELYAPLGGRIGQIRNIGKKSIAELRSAIPPVGDATP